MDEFLVEGPNGDRVPITGVPLKGSYMAHASEDSLNAEYLVRVKWLKTVPMAQAVKEKGFFGNQNSVARPTSPAWAYTIQRLKERFGIT